MEPPRPFSMLLWITFISWSVFFTFFFGNWIDFVSNMTYSHSESKQILCKTHVAFKLFSCDSRTVLRKFFKQDLPKHIQKCQTKEKISFVGLEAPLINWQTVYWTVVMKSRQNLNISILWKYVIDPDVRNDEADLTTGVSSLGVPGVR